MSDYMPKSGDRVRVTIEGEIGKVWDDESFEVGKGPFSNCVAPSEAHVISVEKVTDPRISEPGLYGVVEAETPSTGVRRFCRLEEDTEGWIGAGDWYRWSDLEDPKLIRPGV